MRYSLMIKCLQKKCEAVKGTVLSLSVCRRTVKLLKVQSYDYVSAEELWSYKVQSYDYMSAEEFWSYMRYSLMIKCLQKNYEAVKGTVL